MHRIRRTGLEDPSAHDALELLDREMPGAREAIAQADDAAIIFATTHHPAGERAIGCVALTTVEPDAGVGRIVGPVVDAQMRDLGVGRRLLAEAEREAFGVRRLRRLLSLAPRERRSFLEQQGWAPASSEDERCERLEFVLELPSEEATRRAGQEDSPPSSGGPASEGLE